MNSFLKFLTLSPNHAIVRLAALVLLAIASFASVNESAVAQPTFDNTWLVDDSAPAGGDGSTWGLAFDTLDEALVEADLSDGSDLIRVGQGTYFPSTTLQDPRTATFLIDFDNVTIEGGYAGFGAPNSDARDVFTYVTTLSGLIDYPPNGACGPGAGSCNVAHATPGCDDIACCEFVCSGDAFCCAVEWDDGCAATAITQCPGNKYHVITFTGVDRTARLDGFVITSGSAGGASVQYGGGMLIGSTTDAASPTIVQCRFINHTALIGGAVGVQNTDSAPIFANCTFAENIALQRAGAA